MLFIYIFDLDLGFGRSSGSAPSSGSGFFPQSIMKFVFLFREFFFFRATVHSFQFSTRAVYMDIIRFLYSLGIFMIEIKVECVLAYDFCNYVIPFNLIPLLATTNKNDGK